MKQLLTEAMVIICWPDHILVCRSLGATIAVITTLVIKPIVLMTVVKRDFIITMKDDTTNVVHYCISKLS